MKTKLFLSFLVAFILGLIPTSQAQLNTYFQNNPVWQIHSNCSIGGPCFMIEDYNYYTNGDTLIDSLLYMQIFKKGQGYFDWQAPFQNPGCIGTYTYIDTVAHYFVRSDSRVVMIRQPGDSMERLLYDFNLAIGDTLPISFNNYFRDIVVSGIDSVITPNGYMKRFALSGATWSQYLIEGIGHSRGLTEPLKAPLECAFTLNCYGTNDSSFYPAAGAGCTIAIGIAKYPQKIALSVFPNPFSSSTTFQFDASLRNTELKMYNIYGQSTSIKVAQPNGKIVLQKEMLNSGVYFYEFLHEHQVKASGKFIVE